ncbi:hypothetical protein PENFLA_c018G02588 [Penicillium flavigenum]|uniref:Uncharacterized protein n=1 Tax=Penicillium flavigenum TaxID=254877 RepID=A0A1V6T0F5_9EURO|nr:hypothetical protein PENFLA_c018G02588 [Penicillium flavigenum]
MENIRKHNRIHLRVLRVLLSLELVTESDDGTEPMEVLLQRQEVQRNAADGATGKYECTQHMDNPQPSFTGHGNGGNCDTPRGRYSRTSRAYPRGLPRIQRKAWRCHTLVTPIPNHGPQSNGTPASQRMPLAAKAESQPSSWK